MPYSDEALALRTPAITALPRMEDRIPFLSLDQIRIEQTRTGIEGISRNEDGRLVRIPVPFANIATLILGPGSSITSPALTTLHRHGTTIVFGSADGMTGYASARPLTSSAKWAIAQARTITDDKLRTQAARHLYAQRFPRHELPLNLSLRQLRGFEGRFVRQAYLAERKKVGLTHFVRDTAGQDSVNIALNVTNGILYGIALSVTSALGLSPALGVIHHGASGALLYDLADAFKLDTSLPAAFSVAHSADPAREASSSLRKLLRERNTLHSMFSLTQALFESALPESSDDDVLYDPDGNVAGHTNWAKDDE